MITYRIERKDDALTIALGRARNDQIVKEATARLEEIYSKRKLHGCRLLKVTPHVNAGGKHVSSVAARASGH